MAADYTIRISKDWTKKFQLVKQVRGKHTVLFYQDQLYLKYESFKDLINSWLFCFIVARPKPLPKNKPSGKKWKGVFKPTCKNGGKPPTNTCIKLM